MLADCSAYKLFCCSFNYLYVIVLSWRSWIWSHWAFSSSSSLRVLRIAVWLVTLESARARVLTAFLLLWKELASSASSKTNWPNLWAAEFPSLPFSFNFFESSYWRQVLLTFKFVSSYLSGESSGEPYEFISTTVPSSWVKFLSLVMLFLTISF